jgi:hypothetical protein
MNEGTLSVPGALLDSDDFEFFEAAVFDAVCEQGRALASQALQELDGMLARSAPPGLRVEDVRSRRILTRFGEVEVTRRRFLDPSGVSHYLLDEHLSIPARRKVSPALERAIVALSASVSFREAATIVGDLTRGDVSHATAHSAVARAGERLKEHAAAAAADLHDLGLAPQGEKRADPLHCEADGTVIAMQNTRTRRAEVKLAVFYGEKVGGAGAVHAAFCPAKTFWREASAVAGGVFDLSRPSRVVLSGDGANWVRGGLDVLPHALFTLDPFHVNKALLTATGSYPVARKASATLYGAGLEPCLAGLDRFASSNPDRVEAIQKVKGYLTSNADGLWRADPSLGSIEGHIDKVLAARFKKRGRRWSPAGADRMARVLSAIRSKRPLPVGVWEAPEERLIRRRPTPKELDRVRRSADKTHAAKIVSNRTGQGFTRGLRDIAGTRRADY